MPNSYTTSSSKEVNINPIIKPSIEIDSGGKLRGRESQEVDLGITLIAVVVLSPHNVPTDIPTLLAVQNLRQ